jgi:hypothetical protein
MHNFALHSEAFSEKKKMEIQILKSSGYLYYNEDFHKFASLWIETFFVEFKCEIYEFILDLIKLSFKYNDSRE